jgi:ABC-type nickel/cobalt efflux system permease component RcnA
MGVAGGLVPSPSALLVLFAAIGLGRTWFGVLLVLGYGLGMAGTLTAVGLLLVRLRDRLEERLVRVRANERLARLMAATPILTAVLVLVVGLGLAARGLTGTV